MMQHFVNNTFSRLFIAIVFLSSCLCKSLFKIKHSQQLHADHMEIDIGIYEN